MLPGKLADIDHLVIGPSGITVIDAKTWDGKLWAGRWGLGRGRRVYRRATEGMRHQIHRVHSQLAREGRDDVPVTGVVCMVNANAGIPSRRLLTVDGIDVGHPAPVIRRALRDGPIDATTIDVVHRILLDVFTIHGGSQAPSTRRRPSLLRPILASLSVAIAAVALVSALPASVHSLSKPYRAFSRADLRAHRAEYRAAAVQRARGRVRGPRIRTAEHSFVLTYRRGKRCRVTVTVPRAAPVFGGGRPIAASTGCR